MRFKFVQSITYNEQSIPPNIVARLTYIETLDLSGPKLILDINDIDATIRDIYGLKEHEGAITIEFEDSDGRDEVFFTEQFVIQKVTAIANGGLRVQALAEQIHALWRQVNTATIFKPAVPGDTLKQIQNIANITDAGQLTASQLPAADFQHLLVGGRPATLLCNLATELGAHIYYSRGEWFIQSIDDLFGQDSYADYFHNKPLEKNVFTDVALHGDRKALSELMIRRYMLRDDVNGVTSVGAGIAEMTGLQTEREIAALNKVLIPHLDIQDCSTYADPTLRAGMKLNTEFHRLDNVEDPLNESLPDQILIGSISHHISDMEYSQRIISYIEA